MSKQTEPRERVVLLVGRTGNGKSTIANVLVNCYTEPFKFKESELAESCTQNYQKETLVADGIKLVVVDTIGIGDTKLSVQEVLIKIADACHAVKDGLHQVFFVTRGRLTKEEKNAWDILIQTIFNKDVLGYTTVVRTGFVGYGDSVKCEQDIASMKATDPDLKQILDSCRKIMHVDNVPQNYDAKHEHRKNARLRLITHLSGCDSIYKPPNLSELNNRIKEYKTAEEHANAKLAEAMQKKEKDAAEIAKLKGEIEEANRNKAVATQQHIQQKAPNLWESIFGGVVQLLTRPCVIQ